MKHLLLALAQGFGAVVNLRNWLFDHGLLRSVSHDLPIICVGNLAVGGTGKTPHTEMIVRQLLSEGRHVGILSRGYGRSSKGFQWVEPESSASHVGDEPLQMRLRLPHERLQCAVCESRNRGIRLMRQQHPELEVIVLDDAFQHRWVRPSLSILLTDYAALYDTDQLLPAGRLREPSSGAQRAQVVIVTKCPADLSEQEAQAIAQRLHLRAEQALFFTTIAYASLPPTQRALLITGIARPQPLLEHLHQQGIAVEHLAYPDHHRFTPSDRTILLERAQHYDCVLTTEKDAVRLAELDLPRPLCERICAISIQPRILFNQETIFVETLHNYV